MYMYLYCTCTCMPEISSQNCKHVQCVCGRVCVCMPTSFIVILHFMAVHIHFGVDLGTTEGDEPRLRVRGQIVSEKRGEQLYSHTATCVCMYVYVNRLHVQNTKEGWHHVA